MQRFFYVYVLVSEADETIHYTGTTQDLQARPTKHNQGLCAHTSKHRPWRIQTAIAFGSEVKARAFEKYLKTGSGREFAQCHFDPQKVFGVVASFCKNARRLTQTPYKITPSLPSACGPSGRRMGFPSGRR
jgi:putative endonuclease